MAMANQTTAASYCNVAASSSAASRSGKYPNPTTSHAFLINQNNETSPLLYTLFRFANRSEESLVLPMRTDTSMWRCQSPLDPDGQDPAGSPVQDQFPKPKTQNRLERKTTCSVLLHRPEPSRPRRHPTSIKHFNLVALHQTQAKKGHENK